MILNQLKTVVPRSNSYKINSKNLDFFIQKDKIRSGIGSSYSSLRLNVKGYILACHLCKKETFVLLVTSTHNMLTGRVCFSIDYLS